MKRMLLTLIVVTLGLGAGVAPVLAATSPLSGQPENLGDLISQTYSYALEIVGLCVFLVFLYAGVITMFGQWSKAKVMLRGAVIGTILLFAAYLILNTINPDLVSQKGAFELPF